MDPGGKYIPDWIDAMIPQAAGALGGDPLTKAGGGGWVEGGAGG